MTDLRAPFPWNGGKHPIAPVVWDLLGDVTHYIEPFGGSLAVLLARPHPPQIETVNDLDHFLVNFWRAVQHDPDAVTKYAINPIAEADLFARNSYLYRTSDDFRQKMLNDPEYYDSKLAGWWVWGQSSVIGRPFATDLCRKMPTLLKRGVNSSGIDVRGVMQQLADRLLGVRILYGDWKRCLGPTAIGVSRVQRMRSVGVFLDPPYAEGDYVYRSFEPEPTSIWESVREWVLEYGQYEHIRIVLAGYDDGREMPGWGTVRWKGHGGLGRRSAGENKNRFREVLWVSPHCNQPDKTPTLDDVFEGIAE